MSCRTAVTSDPDREDDEGVERGCGLSLPVAMESSFILLVSARVMCGGGEGECGEEGRTASSNSCRDTHREGIWQFGCIRHSFSLHELVPWMMVQLPW